MKFKYRKTACLLAALCCCAAFAVTGCNGSDPDTDNKTRAVTTEKSIPGVEVYAPEVPKDKIDESVPGKDVSGEINSELAYEDKLTVKLNKVVELDFAKKEDRRVLLAEMTITNKSDESIDCSDLTHFSAKLDGKEDISLVRDVKAAINARKYYTRINSDLQAFNQKISAGQSLSGYVYITAPGSWKELELVYIPYKYFSNDTVSFKIKEEAITHYDVDLDMDPKQPPSEQYTGTKASSTAAGETTSSAASTAAETTASTATTETTVSTETAETTTSAAEAE